MIEEPNKLSRETCIVFEWKMTRDEAELNEELLNEVGLRLRPALRQDSYNMRYNCGLGDHKTLNDMCDRMDIVMAFNEAGYEMDYDREKMLYCIKKLEDLTARCREVLKYVPSCRQEFPPGEDF